MAFKINDAEWNALFDEPPILFKVYGAIRRCMDYKTRLAGEETWINEQYFREVIGYSKSQGRRGSSPISRSTIRVWLERLEKIGLIKHKGKLVFECLLADTEESAQKKYSRSTAKGTARSAAKKTDDNQLIINGLIEEVQPEVQPTILEKYSPPQESGNIYLNKDHLNIYTPKKYLHELPDEFVVTDHHRKLAKKNEWPDPDIEIEAFRDNHVGKGTRWKDWNRSFYQWLRNAKKFNRGTRNATNKRFTEKSQSKAQLLWEVCGHALPPGFETYDVTPEQFDD